VAQPRGLVPGPRCSTFKSGCVGDTKRIEAVQEGEYSGIPHLRSPAGPLQTIVRSRGGASVKAYRAATARPAGESDRVGGIRGRNRPDRRQDVRSHRDDADRSGHVEQLCTIVENDAEAGVRLGAAPWAGCRALD
jgi:hypothetical protein